MTTQEANRRGTGYRDQLRFATSLGRAINSLDKDFLEMAKTDPVHCGVDFIGCKRREIGAIVRTLLHLHRSESPESMENRLAYL